MRIFSVLVLLGLLLCGCKRRHSAGAQARPDVQDSVASVRKNAGPRLFYPYSVVPGGVQSREELEAAIRTDPVVARHYSGIDVGALRTVRLDRDAFAYVSYRMHERIYWTSHKVKLTAGETVFESNGDGVRGRCGNQVSSEPRSPVLDNPTLEPGGEQFDTPEPWETADRQVQPAGASEQPLPVFPDLPPSQISGSTTPSFGSASFAPSGNSRSGIAGGGTFPSGTGPPGSVPAQPTIPSPPTVGPIIPPIPIIAIWPVMSASNPPSVPIVQGITAGPGPGIVLLPGPVVTLPPSYPPAAAPIANPIVATPLPTGGEPSISYSEPPPRPHPPAGSPSSESTSPALSSLEIEPSVPEPTTMQMLIAGAAFLGLICKFRRTFRAS